MLIVDNINTYYDNIHALKGISLEVNSGEIVTLIGSNGAGKTTTLSTITGLIKCKVGKVSFEGKDITNANPAQIVKLGVSLSPEGRQVFPQLTVEKNLELGAFTRKNKSEIASSYTRVYDLFPRLKERIKQQAGTLSGGEQQMLAIGRALMSKPKLLLLDEPSLGLAPNLVMMIFELVKEINNQGTSVLLIEQNAKMALSIAHRAYVIETGKVSLTGNAQDLLNDDKVKEVYFGNLG